MIYENQLVNFSRSVTDRTITSNTILYANQQYWYRNLIINPGVTLFVHRTADFRVANQLTNNGTISGMQLTAGEAAGNASPVVLTTPMDILPSSCNGANVTTGWGTNYGMGALKIMAKKFANYGTISTTGVNGSGLYGGQNGVTYQNNQSGGNAAFMLILAERYWGTGTVQAAAGAGNIGWPPYSYTYSTNCHWNGGTGAYWNCANTTAKCDSQSDWWNMPKDPEWVCDTAVGQNGGGAAGPSGTSSVIWLYTCSPPPVGGASSSQPVTITKVPVTIGGAIFWFDTDQQLEQYHESSLSV